MTIQDVRDAVQRVRDARGRVRVGVPAGPAEKDGTSLAKIARIHEYGVGPIPQRSFLRTGIEHALPMLQKLAAQGMRDIALGRTDIGRALGRVGLAAASAVQREIRDGQFVALKPATILRKGSSKPLIETGSLRQSVTFTVETTT